MEGICHLAGIAIRKQPSHRSEMVSQLIYGERYTVLESAGKEWLNIRCAWDGYEGFIPLNQYSEFKESGAPILFTGSLILDEINNVVSKGAEIYRPDSLVDAEDEEFIDPELVIFNPDQIRERIFLHSTSMIRTPYLWGGRTLFGLDCSGFTQLVYKMCALRLPRDSWQQQQLGDTVSFDESVLGDLAFFQNAEGTIVHTGIIFGNQMIIHCSGHVRIDQLTPAGIMNLDSGEQTHTLHSIKRLISL